MRKFAATLTVAVVLAGSGAPAIADHKPGPCSIHWLAAWRENRNVEPVKRIINCAANRWSVPGGPAKARSVAKCESGFRPDAYGNGNGGVYQHRIRYWPGRYDSYTWPWWQLLRSVYNARTNVIVTMKMVHFDGWGPWAAGKCA